MIAFSWNVNGLRAILNKGFLDILADSNSDIFCLQETKAHPDQLPDNFFQIIKEMGYHDFWNSADKKGYSGTAILTRTKPINVHHGIGHQHHDREGRVITAEFNSFHLVNVYTPNSQNELRRLEYRQQWDIDFLLFLNQLEMHKPVLLCGDLNVAHKEIDLARPAANRRNAGFTDEERAGFSNIIAANYIDSFREFEPGPGHYSWWSYRANARAKNIGWRIDYWCLSQQLRPKLTAAGIRPDIQGSDHCPVWIELTD